MFDANMSNFEQVANLEREQKTQASYRQEMSLGYRVLKI